MQPSYFDVDAWPDQRDAEAIDDPTWLYPVTIAGAIVAARLDGNLRVNLQEAQDWQDPSGIAYREIPDPAIRTQQWLQPQNLEAVNPYIFGSTLEEAQATAFGQGAGGVS